jgi:hypothetical protein
MEPSPPRVKKNFILKKPKAWWILAIRKTELRTNYESTHEVFLGEYANNKGTVLDCYGRGVSTNFKIFKDAQQDLQNMEGTVTLGVKDPMTNVTPSPVAKFYWERDMITNDTMQDVGFLDSYRYAFLYAVPSNTSDFTPFTFTQLSTNGVFNNTRVLVASASFREKVFYNSTTKIVFRAIHACLLLFTWAFAAIIGILIARYLPLLRSTWEVEIFFFFKELK